MNDKAFRKLNGKYYTSESIANFMIKKLNIRYYRPFRLLEPAIGQGHIFILIIEKFLKIHKNTDLALLKPLLEDSFVGFDIDSNSISTCKSKLNTLVLEKTGLLNVNWNIQVINIIDNDSIKQLGLFDYIISNPPYVSRRNITDEQTVNWLKSNSKFCDKFNFDLYYFFIESAMNSWNRCGNVVVITPNSYLRASSAINMRNYLVENHLIQEIIDFGDHLLFEDASTYTAITVLKNNQRSFKIHHGEYKGKKIVIDRTKSSRIRDTSQFYSYDFNLREEFQTLDQLCYISNGLATLNDSAFIIKESEILEKNDLYLTLIKKGKRYTLPRSYIKNVVRPSNPDSENYLIYPYKQDPQNQISNFDVEFEQIQLYFSDTLDEKFVEKYGYCLGRTQGLKFYEQPKIVLPKIALLTDDFTIINNSCYVLAGLYIVMKNNMNNLLPLILDYINSSSVKEYLSVVSKNYNSEYRSISSSDLGKIKIPLHLIEQGE